MTPPTIYYLRHGQTLWNIEHRLQGALDSPLSELGRAQALANAETLLEAVPNLHALPFVSSPLGRARATMEIIRERIGLPKEGYSVDARLAETRFGDWEGLTMKEIRSKFAEDWDERQRVKWTHTPPGGESIEQTAARLKLWLRDVRQDTVVVAHGLVGRIVRGLNLGMPQEEIAFSADPAHDRVYRLTNGTEAAL